MRTVATPGATFGSLVREWQRIVGRLCARRRYACRSNAFGAETSAPLSDLIEALAPLGLHLAAIRYVFLPIGTT